MLKTYPTKTAYQSATLATTESQVSMIVETREVMVDGINVTTTEPEVGDAAFLNESNAPVFLKGGDRLNSALIPDDWTFMGVVGIRRGREVAILNKDGETLKYADVVQFKVTIPSESGTLTMGAQFVTAGTTTSISVEYELDMDLAAATNTYEVNDTTLCGRINTALAALTGITGDWWAYLNSDGDVILQRDTWTDYRQYICSGSLTHVTWGDMPASTSLMRLTGVSTYNAPLSVSKAVSYYGTNGSTPTADWPVASIGFVTKDAFENSTYCAALRAAYSTYTDYIAGAMVRYPMKYGVFGISDGATLSAAYGNLTAPTKSGSTKYKFPALHHGAAVAYSNTNFAAGKWHLMDVSEAQEMMVDDIRTLISATMVAMGATAVTNSVNRWFAERYSASSAWIFGAYYGNLNNTVVTYTYRAQAVTLFNLDS